MSNTENNVIKILTFFDIFEYPLTLLEIIKYYPGSPTPKGTEQSSVSEEVNNVTKIIDKLVEKKKIGTKLGFYFLPNRSKLVSTRFERYNIADEKFKKRLKYIKLLAALPFVKMIMICNSLAYQNCPTSHDIDMAIVTQSGRIWTARFFVVSLLKILGLRPTDKKKQDQLCPSFFFSQDNLNLEKLKFDSGDIFTKYWISQFYPVYAPGKIYHEFINQNEWLKQEFPNLVEIMPAKKRLVRQSKFTRSTKSFFEKIVSVIPEKSYKKIESKALPSRLKEMANKTTSVVITDSILKFHDNDIRSNVKQTFEQKLNEYSQST